MGKTGSKMESEEAVSHKSRGIELEGEVNHSDKEGLAPPAAPKEPVWNAHSRVRSHVLNMGFSPRPLQDVMAPQNSVEKEMDLDSPGHILLVLGCAVDENGIPSDRLQVRINKAIELAHRWKKVQVVGSGGSVHNEHGEADAIAHCLIKSGVEEGRIWRETRAVSTLTNATGLLSMRNEIEAVSGRIHTITVVTEPFHMMRGLRAMIGSLAAEQVPRTKPIRIRAAPSEPVPWSTRPPKWYKSTPKSLFFRIGEYKSVEKCIRERALLLGGN